MTEQHRYPEMKCNESPTDSIIPDQNKRYVRSVCFSFARFNLVAKTRSVQISILTQKLLFPANSPEANQINLELWTGYF